MVIADRVSLRAPVARAQSRPTPALAADRAEVSELARTTQCPTGQGSKAYRALGEQAACAAGGGAALAPAARQLEQFRQGLCPYLAQATQNSPQDMSALTALSQALQEARLDPVEFFERAADTFGPTFQVGDVRFESRPEVVQQILVGTQSAPTEDRPFSKSPLQRASLGALLGHESLFLAEDQPWQTRRELMQPFFNGQHVLNDKVHAEVKKVVERHLDRWGPVEDLGFRLKELTLDSALNHMFGVQLSDQELTGATRLFERAGRQATDLLFGRTGAGLELRPELEALADRLIQGNGEMLQGLKQALPDAQALRQEVLTMALLGHETTANLLSWALADVTRSPERLRAVRREIDAELQAGSTFHATQSLQETRDLVRDTAGAHPPNYLLMREARRDVELEGEYLARGTQVLMPLSVVNAGKVFSFGSGRRVCLGQVFARLEANLILAEILRRFELEPVQSAAPGPLTEFSSAPADNRYRLRPR